MAPPALDPRVEKSFDFLQDATKQVITLATAVLTFTLTFLKDLAGDAGADTRVILTSAWIALVGSAVAGLLVLLSMTGMLGRLSSTPDIYSPATRVLSLLQLGLFALALVLALIFGASWATP